MKEILEKKNKGEDIEAIYSKLVECRKRRHIYSVEERMLIEKQFAMQ
jgi:hypothetical protein